LFTDPSKSAYGRNVEEATSPTVLGAKDLVKSSLRKAQIIKRRSLIELVLIWTPQFRGR
jgi:hypothetical protein